MAIAQHSLPISTAAAEYLCEHFQGTPKFSWQNVQIGPRLEVKQDKPDTYFGLPKLPAAYATVVMPLLLSILMTCLVSLVSTLRGIGLAHNLLQVWLGAWAISWVIAFPTLLLVLPLVRRATYAIVRAE